MAGAKPQRASRAKVKFMFYSKYKEKLLGGFKPGRDAVIGLWRGAFGVSEGGLYGARAAERRQWPGLAQVKKGWTPDLLKGRSDRDCRYTRRGKGRDGS